ncbi:ComGF family competence protein [Companilactobacillus kimchiensis]|nr:ComGF family competence protein [Companilactobacillus kimchiensis]
MYEAVVALIVTIMTLGILQQSLQILKRVQNTSFREQVRWHITQEKLQSLLDENKVIDVNDQQILYLNLQTNKKWMIEKYGPIVGDKMLRITTAADGGHEPILTNLQKINIEKFRNLVIITTVNKAGQKSEMCLTYAS